MDRTDTAEVLAQLAEEETREREAQAERIVRANREQQEYTAKIKARRDNFLRELEAELANLWRVLPELRWHVQGLRQLERRLDELGDGRSWEDVTGLPFGLGDRLSREIGQALAGTWLGDEAFTPGKVSVPNTSRKPGPMIHFAPDRRPPPGYSGVWPPEAYDAPLQPPAS